MNLTGSSIENSLANKEGGSVKPLVLLVAGLTCVGFFTSHASMSLDPPNRLKVTQSIVDHGDIQVRLTADEEAHPEHMGVATTIGADGNRYLAYHGIGQSLLFVPPYYVVRHLLGIESPKLTRSLISLTLFPLTLGLTAWIFFLLLREFGFPDRRCFLASILVVLGTGLWELSRECQDDSHLAFLFVLTAYGLRRYQKTAALRFLALSSVSIGFAFITRSDTAPTVLCFLLFAFWLIYRGHRDAGQSQGHAVRIWPYLLVLGLTFPALVIEISHNLFRFSHPIMSYEVSSLMPYEMDRAELLILGLKGLLLSPGKSIFLYNPLVILAVPGLFYLWQRHRGWALYIFAGFTGCLLLHAAYPSFHGNICWGARYLCRYLPLLLLPAVVFAFADGPLSKIRLWLFGLVACASVVVQVASVSLHYNRDILELDMAYEETWSEKGWTMFEPEAHFLERRFGNIATSVSDMAHGRIAPWPTDPTYTITQAEQLQVPALNYLAFWPFHLTYYLPSTRPDLAVPLWASTLIFLGGVAVGLLLLLWGWRSCTHRMGSAKVVRQRPQDSEHVSAARISATSPAGPT